MIDENGLVLSKSGDGIEITNPDGTLDFLIGHTTVGLRMLYYKGNGVNLAVDGDFSSGGLGYWTVSGTAAVEQATDHLGNVARLTGVSSLTSANYISGVAAGKRYLLQADVRRVAGMTDSVGVKISWYTAAFALISTLQYLNFNSNEEAWQRLSQIAVAPATAVYAKVVCAYPVASPEYGRVGNIVLREATYAHTQTFAAAANTIEMSDALNILGLLTAQAGADMNGQKIVNLADPVNAQDAVTKAYADLMQRNGESVLGSTFSITGTSGTWQDTGLSIALPGAGTYLVQANVRGFGLYTAGTSGFLSAKLYNATDAADVANSERLIIYIDTSAQAHQVTIPITVIVTVAAAKTINLYAKRQTATTWTSSQIASDANGRTSLSYKAIK